MITFGLVGAGPWASLFHAKMISGSGAERIATAAADAGVTTMLMIRNRFDPRVIDYLEQAKQTRPRGLMASFITGAALSGSVFATPWRVERGALLDIGPHTLDMVDALLGPVIDLKAVGDPLVWVGITTLHEGGAVGQVSLSITTPGADNALRLSLVTESGTLALEVGKPQPDTGVDPTITVQRSIMAAFTEAIGEGRDHPLGVQRGLELQRLIAAVEDSMESPV